MSATSEAEYAAVKAVGERMMEAAREWLSAYVPPAAPAAVRDELHAHGLLTALMQAMPEGNEAALARGFGVALGSWIALHGDTFGQQLHSALNAGIDEGDIRGVRWLLSRGNG